MTIVENICETLEVVCNNHALVYAILINGDKIKDIANRRADLTGIGELYILCDINLVRDVEEALHILHLDDISTISMLSRKLPRIDISVSSKHASDIKRWHEDDIELKFMTTVMQSGSDSDVSSSSDDCKIDAPYIDIGNQKCYTNGIIDNEHDVLARINHIDTASISEREEIYARLFAVWESLVM